MISFALQITERDNQKAVSCDPEHCVIANAGRRGALIVYGSPVALKRKPYVTVKEHKGVAELRVTGANGVRYCFALPQFVVEVAKALDRGQLPVTEFKTILDDGKSMFKRSSKASDNLRNIAAVRRVKAGPRLRQWTA